MKSIKELMSLENRGVYITGGAGHIGLAIAETVMELGANAFIVDMTQEACDQRCDELNAKDYKGKAAGLALDIADEKALRQSVHQAKEAMGSLDVICHSAAFVGTTEYPGWVVPFEEQTVDAWNACMNVNQTAAFVMVQEALPYLRASKKGSVILISSIHGMVGPDMGLYEGTKMGNPMAYGASKAGLMQMARYLGTVMAPDVRANCISPGGVWRNQREEFHKRYLARTPHGRMAAEEDLKGAVAYFATDLSVYTTGQNLVVDGGYTAW